METLTRAELNLLLSSLEEMAHDLHHRFEEEEGYIHPALKYELLNEKLKTFYENTSSDNYSVAPL